MINEALFALIRAALTGESPECPCTTNGEWSRVYELANKQCVVALAYRGICLLPKASLPPLGFLFQWASETEVICGHNKKLNEVAKNLTQAFAKEGHKSVILKGPANARLYPNKYARQCGDIDIWVEGDKAELEDLLLRMGLTDVTHQDIVKKFVSYSHHHIHLEKDIDGVTVEVHFKPSGNLNPFTNLRLQKWMAKEVRESTMTEEGFYTPSIRFALIMQLSHIQRHFISSGIGLKQLVDYYVLLNNSTGEDRKQVSQLLRRFGLWNCAGALMWTLEKTMHLDKSLMLCKPNKNRGSMMLDRVLYGGYFGKYNINPTGYFWTIWIKKRLRTLNCWRFSKTETFWTLADYFRTFFRSIPVRVKLKKISLREFFENYPN